MGLLKQTLEHTQGYIVHPGFRLLRQEELHHYFLKQVTGKLGFQGQWQIPQLVKSNLLENLIYNLMCFY